VVLGAGSLACQGAATWGLDRLRDASDVLDLRYGTGLGLGVHADATLYFGTGLGWSTVDHSRAWFGRHAVARGETEFFGLVLGSTLGGGMCPPDLAHGWWHMLVFNVVALDSPDWAGDANWFENDGGPPLIDRFRFGGVLFLPGVHVGLHLNVGEVFDLLLGLFTLDPAHDDGIPKFTPS
jgi:hypothetical protein